jgi:hypothetical protein
VLGCPHQVAKPNRKARCRHRAQCQKIRKTYTRPPSTPLKTNLQVAILQITLDHSVFPLNDKSGERLARDAKLTYECGHAISGNEVGRHRSTRIDSHLGHIDLTFQQIRVVSILSGSSGKLTWWRWWNPAHNRLKEQKTCSNGVVKPVAIDTVRFAMIGGYQRLQ